MNFHNDGSVDIHTIPGGGGGGTAAAAAAATTTTTITTNLYMCTCLCA